MKNRQKYLTTAAVYYCNLALGVSATFLAPILIDFRNAFHTDTQAISLVITICRVIVLISALSFGVIFNYVNRHIVVTCLVLIMGLTGILFPHAGTLLYFGILFALQSFSAGGYLTAQVVWIIEIWKDAAGPYIQAQHFFFALGCIFPPLIFAPYLNKNSNDTDNANTTFIMDGVVLEEPSSLKQLYLPCAICGGIIAAGALFLFVNYCAFNGMPESSSSQETVAQPSDAEKTEDSGSEEEIKPKNKEGDVFKKVLLIALSSALIGGVESMEGITMSFLPVFGHYSDLHLSESEGAQLLSAYSIAYTVSRLAGIFIILKVSARWILCGNLLIVVIANVVLLFLGSGSLTYMYLGSILLGIGFSTSVPSVFAYAQLHLEVTNVVGSVLMVAGASLAAVFPVIVGSFIEKTPKVLMYLNLGCVIACLGCLITIFLLMRKTSGKL